MKIGVFVVMAGRNAGGPETYEHSLVRNLLAIDPHNEYHIYCFSQEAARSFGIEASNVFYHVLRPTSRVLAVSVGLPLAMTADGIDLMHAACVPPLVSPVPYVSTLHCSSTFMRPELYPPLVRMRLKALVRQGMKHARHTVCVSQNVKDLAVEHFGVSPDRLSVIYNGVGDHFQPLDENARRDVLTRYGIEGPYLLFVGRFEPRKNVVRLLEAFDIFRNEVDREAKLVLAGNKTWAREDVDRTIERLGLTPSLIEIGHVANEDLPALYAGARAFLFPSLWEGFGIPVVEAMACGTPVLTSSVSCLPEIADGAATLVDPTSVRDIAEGIERVVCDAPLRAELRTRGLYRAADFSWRRNAEQMHALYQKFAPN